MTYFEKYQEWINSPYIDHETKSELIAIKNNPKEIEERFYKNLEFGTGGLRGIIGAGINRMNRYTVRRATQGFSNYLIQQIENATQKGIAIAYDSRHCSSEFAQEAALVFIANGFKVYLFESLHSTPELSFAVRELGCAGGVVITASHNPAEYNGYKVYGEDGGQIVPHKAEQIISEIEKVRKYEDIPYLTKEEAFATGRLEIIGEDMDKRYIDQVKNLVIRKERIQEMARNLKIVYTPLHGTGNRPVRRVLKEVGFEHVSVVTQQEKADPDFPTVKLPNPEEQEAFTLALKLADAIQADIIIGTDPDCDRVGAVVKNRQGEYEILTGNQTGVLLIDYILSSKKEKGELPQNGVIIKTIVTSQMGAQIAQNYGVDTLDTLTGFKFIGEKIQEFEETEVKKFLFGYEESYGYLAGTFVRDKDAVIASLLICEMAAYYKMRGLTLYDVLMKLYAQYGYYKEDLQSVTLKGKDGLDKMQKILDALRSHPPKVVAGKKIDCIQDYQIGKSYDITRREEKNIDLPRSNVLHFTLQDSSWFCVRPSGTEPKIKIYFSVIGETMEEAEKKLEGLKDSVMHIFYAFSSI
jgi:phosphoglucomutase